MAEQTLREALTRGLHEALTNDSRVFIMGEDIGAYGGAYAVTKGFLQEFGPERIKDTPISESAIVGAGVGAAMGGLRPVVELMTINFSLLASDQIVNHAAKIHYMSNGQFSSPLLIRTVTGGGGGLGATHSQSFEGWYATVPGLKVVLPSTPYDALGLLRSCFKDENPIIFCEHALLYGTRGEVPDEYYEVPLGKANVAREGKDLTIVAYSRMVQIALGVANKLSENGTEAEVVDLRCLRPLDIETVLQSVAKTNRCLILDEAWSTGAYGTYLGYLVQQAAFDHLDAPILHVGGADAPAPYARNIEQLAIPNEASVIKAIQDNFGF
ncbi:alpha-ketoacid dehydrogenase subunit beta [SAR202 cluster bacterium AD-802-E10_MRT_200m]|nr:alpha-ketoacid dehydrogenase subunit beta [SAR202 cluster bacterium AD-802-E10_MRT_200m]